jgi:hypothetical protein
MQEEEFNKYKESFNPYMFKDLVLKEYLEKNENMYNPIYYENFTNEWHTQRLQELINNDGLKERIELLKGFLLNVKYLINSIIELYIAIERCDDTKSVRINRVNIKKHEVVSMLIQIADIKTSIQCNDKKERNDLALKIRNYCFYTLDEVQSLLGNNLHVNIGNSPLKKKLKEVEKSLLEPVMTSNKSVKKDSEPQYLEVTRLIAQGFIYFEQSSDKSGKKFCYKENKFHELKELNKFLKNILTIQNYRQYVEDTLNESKGSKDLYSNRTILKKTYQYCSKNNIKMTPDFELKYNELNN